MAFSFVSADYFLSSIRISSFCPSVVKKKRKREMKEQERKKRGLEEMAEEEREKKN